MKTAEQVKTDVEQELRWEPGVDAAQIGVSVKDGVVELDGHVGSFYEKWGAERAALRVANVKSIASEIKVDLCSTSIRTDEDIARVASSQLTWNFLVPDTIKLKVSDGWVTLEGSVEWQYQREEAERLMRPLHGIRGVSNDIQLQPKVNATGVKIRIEEALRPDAQIDSGKISVEAAAGAVILRGSIHSWSERQEAEHAAFGAPGVASVSNLIEVRY